MENKLKLAIDISPLIATPKTGINILIEGILDELILRNNVALSYFAVLPRAKIKIFQPSYPDAYLIPVPARLLNSALSLVQRLNIPVEMFVGSAQAALGFDWLCLPLRIGVTLAIVADTTPLSDPQWYSKEQINWFKRRMDAVKINADVVIAISNTTKDEIIKNTMMNEEKIKVCYPGLAKPFHKKPSKQLINQVSKIYKLPDDYLLCIGKGGKRKNLHRIFAAFHVENSHRQRKKSLVVVGSGPKHTNHLRRKNIYNIGYVPDEHLPAIYARSSGLLYPSLKEGFGFPIIEAFAMGIPVLTSNTSSLKEIASTAAILVDPYSKKSVHSGIKEMFNLSEKKRKLLLLRGKRRLEKFSFKNMIDEILNCISECQ